MRIPFLSGDPIFKSRFFRHLRAMRVNLGRKCRKEQTGRSISFMRNFAYLSARFSSQMRENTPCWPKGRISHSWRHPGTIYLAEGNILYILYGLRNFHLWLRIVPEPLKSSRTARGFELPIKKDDLWGRESVEKEGRNKVPVRIHLSDHVITSFSRYKNKIAPFRGDFVE